MRGINFASGYTSPSNYNQNQLMQFINKEEQSLLILLAVAASLFPAMTNPRLLCYMSAKSHHRSSSGSDLRKTVRNNKLETTSFLVLVSFNQRPPAIAAVS